MNYDWKQMSVSVRISHADLPKTFGEIKRRGKFFYRNYHHPLKNGKGMSYLDVFNAQLEKVAGIKVTQVLFGKPKS
jgi:hypothetical protein